MLEEQTKDGLRRISLKNIFNFITRDEPEEIDGVLISRCPFHGDGTAKTLVIKGDRYYCLDPKCGASGNVLTLYAQRKPWSDLNTLEFLKINNPWLSIKTKSGSAEIRSRIREAKKALKAAEAVFQSHATGYWKTRGLSDTVIKNFGLGYTGRKIVGNSHPLYDELLEQGFSRQAVFDAGLATEGDAVRENGQTEHYLSDTFRERAMIPIRDADGTIIGFGGRALSADVKPKYKNTKETIVFDKSTTLFALDRAKKSDSPFFILCEGYMDVIAMHRYGFTNTVASLGTALTPEQADIMKMYKDEVVVMYDSDGPGMTAARRAYWLLRDAGLKPMYAHVPKAKDPDELLRSGNVGAIATAIQRAQTVANSAYFFYKRPEEEIATDEGRETLFKDLLDDVIERTYSSRS